jgi:hypothetical protein
MLDKITSMYDAYYTGMLLYSESTILLCSLRRLCVEFKIVLFKSLASVRTMWYFVRSTRTFRLDSNLCPEASNCSWLHPSGRLSNTSGRPSMFDKQNDFFPKHRYGKTAAAV